MADVILEVRHGLVTVAEAPGGISVHLKDYDVDGYDESTLKVDEEGKRYAFVPCEKSNATAPTKEMVISWSIEDVLWVANHNKIYISESDAGEILDEIMQDHDAELGVTWETIRCKVEEFGHSAFELRKELYKSLKSRLAEMAADVLGDDEKEYYKDVVEILKESNILSSVEGSDCIPKELVAEVKKVFKCFIKDNGGKIENLEINLEGK